MKLTLQFFLFHNFQPVMTLKILAFVVEQF